MLNYHPVLCVPPSLRRWMPPRHFIWASWRSLPRCPRKAPPVFMPPDDPNRLVSKIGDKDHELGIRLAKLSDGQRVCLLLVAQHLSSKEIAQQMGISRHTVD